MFRGFQVLLTTALLVCATAYADPPGRVARLNYAAGAVSFAPAEAPDAWTQAVLNRPLTGGDRLWADQSGRAELHVGSTALRLGAMTSVDILNLDDDTLQIRLAQGSVNLRVRDLDSNDIIEIATPSGAVLVRQPGSYRITADPYGDVSRVLVNFGQAEVVTPVQTFTVPSSQSATISAGGRASFEIAAYASADDLDRWSAERDRQEDRVTSTRYVSRDMTGYEDLDQHGAWSTVPEYGAVWTPTRVSADWAPYRQGHWAWVSPWGWTWIDDAPWGFAPFHYGRWVRVHNYWAWAPGAIHRRPVYAPALVAFVGGSSFSVSVRSGPAVGWFPLGWREPYIPWYRTSPRYVQNVNVTHVTNVTNITNVTNVRYVHRDRGEGVTVVPRQAFVSARPVAQSNLIVSRNELARAEVVRDRSPADPVRASFAPQRPGQRPPASAAAREVVAVNAPPTQAGREQPAWRDRSGFNRDDAEPRVRMLRRERIEANTAAPATGAGAGAVGAAVPLTGGAAMGAALRDAAAQRERNAIDAREAARERPADARDAARERARDTRETARERRDTAAPAAVVTTTAPPAAAAPATPPQPRTQQPDRRRDATSERRDGSAERRDGMNDRRDAASERRERSADPAVNPSRQAAPARADAAPVQRIETAPAPRVDAAPSRPRSEAAPLSPRAEAPTPRDNPRGAATATAQVHSRPAVEVQRSAPQQHREAPRAAPTPPAASAPAPVVAQPAAPSARPRVTD
jgi:hypothetical protein